MIDTPFVTFFVRCGWTTREARCVERWLDDHKPAGKSPENFLAAIQHGIDRYRHMDLHEIGILQEKVQRLEDCCEVFGVRRSALLEG